MLLLALSTYVTQAQDIQLKTSETQFAIDSRGYYTSIKVNQQEILEGKQYPLVSAGKQGELITPTHLSKSGNQLRLTMSDGGKITLRYKEADTHVRLEASAVPTQYDILLFGPLGVRLNEVVGEVVGVVQGEGLAFGAQALNIKTTAGLPDECSLGQYRTRLQTGSYKDRIRCGIPTRRPTSRPGRIPSGFTSQAVVDFTC